MEIKIPVNFHGINSGVLSVTWYWVHLKGLDQRVRESFELFPVGLVTGMHVQWNISHMSQLDYGLKFKYRPLI